MLPHAPPGARVGVFGGSFDPAHDGHLHVSRHALRALRLDGLWWLVSPGNPLKAAGPAPLAQRLARARALADDPRITVTAAEATLGTRLTADTLAALRARSPRVHFVWVMGADNLAGFHRWDRWRTIARLVPVLVIARPGAQRAALAAPAARVLAAHRVPARDAAALPGMPPPAWCYLRVPMRAISSSALRAQGRWPPRGQ